MNDEPLVVISYGDEEPRGGGIMGLDAAGGRARWEVKVEREMFALPVPMEIREDGTSPWLFGGRDGQLTAVDANSGSELWRFEPAGQPGRDQGFFNFYTGRELFDADDDGISDYVVTNGGDYQAEPRAERPPGHLLVLSGKDGSPIHRIEVPEGRETYCSVLVWNRAGKDWIIFGTGGETFAGSLWAVPVDSVRDGKLSGRKRIVYNVGAKGYVAPPSLADIDGDGTDELIATPFDGRLLVLSGKNARELWKYSTREEAETQSSPAIGDFDGDGDLDIAHVVQNGEFPQWVSSSVRAFNAGDGRLLWEYTTDTDLSAASPLAVDVDADGRDELVFIQSRPAHFRPDVGGKSTSRLNIVHVDEKRIETIGELDGFNAGTGLITDADGDGTLEWYIPFQQDDQTGTIVRMDLNSPTPDRISWGGYLGTKHDGRYAKN